MLSLMAVAAAGCDRGNGTAGRPKVSTRVAVVAAGPTDPLWPVVTAGAARFADGFRSVGVEFHVPSNAAPAAQQESLRKLLADPPDALCVHVSDPRALGPAIDELAQKGVAVVTLGRDCPGSQRRGFIGFDKLAIGAALADELRTVLGERRAWMLLTARTESGAYEDIRAGFDRGLRQGALPAPLKRLDCQADPFRAVQIINDQMALYPALRAWVALDDWPLQVVDPKDALLPDTCALVCFGPWPDNWRFVEDGTCAALIGADFENLGWNAVNLAVSLVTSTGPADLRPLPIRVIRRDTLTEFRRDWQRWIGAAPATPPTTTR